MILENKSIETSDYFIGGSGLFTIYYYLISNSFSIDTLGILSSNIILSIYLKMPLSY